jgi:glycosyltransferase involved in cell wall biosynthesis
MANAASPHTHRWATAYAQRGHETHVVSIRAGDIPGVTVHRVGFGGGGRLMALLSYLRLLFSARRLLRRLDPDLVHAHYSVTHGVIASLSGRRPILLTLWGSDILRGDRAVGPFGRLLNRFALRRADAVTSASEFMAGVAAEIGKRPVEVVPFGVDVERFRPVDGAEGGGLVVGQAKHLEDRYGTDVLVDAVAIAASEIPGLRLILAGEGSRREALEARVARTGLGDRVAFLGALPHDDMPGFMGSLDVLVNASRSESFGVAVLEGSASGLPVVVTRVGGAPETVIDGETGILVPPEDPAALASALVALATDRTRRRAMGEAGRRWVVEQFSWDRSVDAMISIADRLVAR